MTQMHRLNLTMSRVIYALKKVLSRTGKLPSLAVATHNELPTVEVNVARVAKFLYQHIQTELRKLSFPRSINLQF
jgi:hypothetical protein